MHTRRAYWKSVITRSSPRLLDQRTGPYTEAAAWQYRFYVPHEPRALADAYDAAAAARGLLYS